MDQIELLHRADEQEVILRMATAIEQILTHGMVGQSPSYLSALARRGRVVGYEQMTRQTKEDAA
jgi:hypothetical protein